MNKAYIILQSENDEIRMNLHMLYVAFNLKEYNRELSKINKRLVIKHRFNRTSIMLDRQRIVLSVYQINGLHKIDIEIDRLKKLGFKKIYIEDSDKNLVDLIYLKTINNLTEQKIHCINDMLIKFDTFGTHINIQTLCTVTIKDMEGQ